MPKRMKIKVLTLGGTVYLDARQVADVVKTLGDYSLAKQIEEVIKEEGKD
jgi:hypothetical protein